MSAKDSSRIHVPTPEEIESLGGDASKHDAGQRQDEPVDADALRAERDHWKDRAHRAAADYRNLERRAESQRYDASQAAIGQFVRGLLTVIDDLERTLAAAEKTADPTPVIQGVRLVYDKLIKALAEQGIETITAVGEPFDPTRHEALMSRPSDEHAEHVVIEELARGYRMGERILRPAKVVVSSGPGQ
jgi:molecular chaperone GrpE